MVSSYWSFNQAIENININIIPFFGLLGFTQEHKEYIVKALLSVKPYAIKNTYIELITEKVKAGKVKLEKVLSKKTLQEREETQEQREKRLDREIHRALLFRYKELEKKFYKEYKPSTLYYDREALEVLQDSLILTPSGFSIDEDKFIRIFGDYLESKGSTTFEEHKKVADTINHFFNGAVAITQEELDRYFRLDCGIVIPNPLSITRESYLRLGYKGNTKLINKK